MASDDTWSMTSHIPEIIEALHVAVGKSVELTAQAIVDSYEARAPRDTGFMASTGYITTHARTTYGAHLHGDGPMLPQIAHAENDQTAYAAVAAAYAAYPEYGTVHMASRPAFTPAVESAAQVFEKFLSELEKVLSGEGIK